MASLHRIKFSFSVGARSAWLKSIFMLAFAPAAFFGLAV